MAKKEVKSKEAKMVEFTVTEEYLTANPSLTANGIEVGDLIEISKAEFDAIGSEGCESKAKKPAVVAKGAMAVLKNGTEFVRVYESDQSAELEEFLSKDGAYTAVPASTIAGIEVPYSVKQKDGSINRTEKKFDDFADAILFRNEHRSICKVIFAKK